MKTRVRKRLWFWLLPALGLAAGCAFSGEAEKNPKPVPAPFHVDGRWFKDAQGRVAIFRGINVTNTVKWPPYEYWTQEHEWDLMQDWGVNLVRLLMAWETIEPDKGRYTDWFFEERSDQQVAWAEPRGIYILLDMHMDVYGRMVAGNGAPDWATRTDIPFKAQSPWGINYLARATAQSYDDLWTSPELQAHYIGAWMRAVKYYRFRKIVIGYDLFNEPFCGTISPWEFSRKTLPQFQDRVAAVIRTKDPGRIIFYEPLIFTSSGMAVMMPPPRVGNVALAPHYYDPVMGFLHEKPYDQDPSRIHNMMDLRDQEMKAMGGIAWLMGEFGVGVSAPDYNFYLRDFYNELDLHMGSGTIYEMSRGGMGPLNPDGSENTVFLNEMVRTYPQRIAGEPLNFSFNSTTKVFTLTYKQVKGVTGPTEIFIPEARHYPGGFTLQPSTWNMRTEWDGRILKVYLGPEVDVFTITIKPAT